MFESRKRRGGKKRWLNWRLVAFRVQDQLAFLQVRTTLSRTIFFGPMAGGAGWYGTTYSVTIFFGAASSGAGYGFTE